MILKYLNNPLIILVIGSVVQKLLHLTQFIGLYIHIQFCCILCKVEIV
jgi:hypothetical protein